MWLTEFMDLMKNGFVGKLNLFYKINLILYNSDVKYSYRYDTCGHIAAN
jgi:hypothetical protein